MSEAIELEEFVAQTKLPDGFKFKEWQPGCIIGFGPGSDGNYLSTLLCAIERTADGKFSQFEIPYLHLGGRKEAETMRGKLMVRKSDLESAVDKAIAELSTTCG